MSKLVARHGLSYANMYGTPAYGSPDASLSSQGIEQAEDLGLLFQSEFGINVAEEAVAVSAMKRSQETATNAGFVDLTIYSELDEVKGSLTGEEIRAAIGNKMPPEATRLAARRIIENPPEQRVWVSHGLLISAICFELGIYEENRFIPKFCEVRELPL